MIHLPILALTLLNLAGKPMVSGVAGKLVVFTVAYGVEARFCIGFWNETLLVYRNIYPLDAVIVNNKVCMVSVVPAPNETRPWVAVGCGSDMYILAPLAETPPPYRVGLSKGKPYFIAGYNLIVLDEMPRCLRFRGFKPVDYLDDVIVAVRLSREPATAFVEGNVAHILEGFEAIDAERLNNYTLLLAGVYRGYYVVAKVDLLKGKAVIQIFKGFKPPRNINPLDASIASCGGSICVFVLNNSVLVWNGNTTLTVGNLGVVQGVHIENGVVTVASLVEGIKPLKPKFRVAKCAFEKLEVTLYKAKVNVMEGVLKPYRLAYRVEHVKPRLARLGENLQLTVFTLQPVHGTAREKAKNLDMLIVFAVVVTIVATALWVWRRKRLGGVRSSPSG